MTSLDDLLEALAEHGEGACILAGGQSLVPLMNLRMAYPEILLDINRIDALSGIQLQDNHLVIGALTRHAEVFSSPLIARHAPLIKMAMAHVAHEAVRNRGTFGGSISLADPAAEMPACCLALDAEMELQSLRGHRRVAAKDFFLGSYETARAEDEVLVAVHIPIMAARTRPYFDELSRRRGDYALAGLAAYCTVTDSVWSNVRLVYFGIEDRPIRAGSAEAALTAGREDAIDAAAVALEADLDPVGDPQTSAAARRQFAQILLRRAVGQWMESERTDG